MILVGSAFWIVNLALYAGVLGVVAVLLQSAQRQHRLKALEWNGSMSVLALRVAALTMLSFPVLVIALYVPFSAHIGGVEVVWKPRFIQSGRITLLVAAALAVYASISALLVLQRRTEPRLTGTFSEYVAAARKRAE